MTQAMRAWRATTALVSDQSQLIDDARPGHELLASASTTQRFLTLFDPGGDLGPFGSHYHNVKGWVVDSVLDTCRLEVAFQRTLEANEALRTSLRRAPDGSLQQVIRPALPGAIRFTHSFYDERPWQELADEFIASVEASTIRADQLPAARLECLVTQDKTVVVIIAHHVVTDGLSVRTMFDQLRRFYEDDEESSKPVLQSREVPDEHVAADDTRLDYWQQHLSGAMMTGILTQGPPAEDFKRTSELRFSLPGDAMTRYATMHRCSPFMVLLAGYAQLLYDRTGVEDICVPALTVGRPSSAYEAVGAFFNFVPMRIRLEGASSFEEVLARTRRTCLEALQHEVPFEAILSRCPDLMAGFAAPNRAVGGIQSLDNPYGAEGSFGPYTYRQIRDRSPFQHVTSDIPNGFLLSFEVERKGSVWGNIRFNLDEITRVAAQSLVDDYLTILNHATTTMENQHEN